MKTRKKLPRADVSRDTKQVYMGAQMLERAYETRMSSQRKHEAWFQVFDTRRGRTIRAKPFRPTP